MRSEDVQNKGNGSEELECATHKETKKEREDQNIQ